jgi:hypothetical protein
MKTDAEQRACERHRYAADIAVSHFNKEYSYNTHTLNIGTGGMCFKSNLFFQPEATLYIRLKKTHPNGSCSGFCEGLHIVTLAEVKWCHETNGAGAFPYEVGVKYFRAAY